MAANHLKLQGAFTDDLSRFLLEVEAEATEEMPGVFDELLMVDLMGDGLLAAVEAEEKQQDAAAVKYEVIIECVDAVVQREVYGRLSGEGFDCSLGPR